MAAAHRASNLVSSVSEPHSCIFPLDDDSAHAFTLSDGRKFEYAEYGSQKGQPIFYLHGLPGSRIEAASLHVFGLELGVRIISTDRPGIEWSSPHPNRALLDFPKDLQRLADHLGLEAYSVLGVSGGGPYVLACAVSLPREKLKCVSIVCGLGPPDVGMSGANWWNWLGFTWGWRYAPTTLMRWYMMREPTGRLDITGEERLQIHLRLTSKITDDGDRAIMQDKDFARLLLRSTRESFRQGFNGTCEDGRLMCLDHGFKVEEIRPDLLVHLWYGGNDTFVPIHHGDQIAARLGGRAHFRLLEETHASIWMNRRREMLKSILQ